MLWKIATFHQISVIAVMADAYAWGGRKQCLEFLSSLPPPVVEPPSVAKILQRQI